MNYIGEYHLGQTVRAYLSTHTQAGGNVAPSTAFENADVVVYKNGDVTPITAGITVTSPFNSKEGFHLVEIDTSDNAYARMADYTIVLQPDDETIDGQTITAVPIAQFAIENRLPPHGGFRTTIASVTSNTQFVLTDAPLPADTLNGWAVLIKDPTLDHRYTHAVIKDYALNTKEVTLAYDPGFFTVQAGDVIEIMPIGQLMSVVGQALQQGASGAEYTV